MTDDPDDPADGSISDFYRPRGMQPDPLPVPAPAPVLRQTTKPAMIQGRKWKAVLLDTGVSVGLFFAGKYLSPELAEDIHILIGLLQPVFAAYILGTAHEDAAEKKGAASVLAATAQGSQGVTIATGGPTTVQEAPPSEQAGPFPEVGL
jgi:hypothetical protein